MKMTCMIRCNLLLVRSAMATAICAFIRSTCNKLGYITLVAVICRQMSFHCHLVQFPTVLTTLTLRPGYLAVAPVSALRKSHRRCSEKCKCFTFVPTVARFTGRAAITRKYMRSFRTFCLMIATADRGMSYVELLA